MRLSSRGAAVAESATLRLAAELSRLRAAGKDVISLLEGESELDPPATVTAATAQALKQGLTRYSNAAGLPELRTALAAKLKKENGVSAAPEDILVTNGAKQAIYTALQTLCGPGDEVVIPAPYWVTFPSAVLLAGARPVFAPALGRELPVDAIARAVTKRTKAVIINTPNNPTGAVYGRDELKALAALARKKDLFLVCDEAYERLVYDGRRHVSLASLGPDAARRTVTVQTFSKSYAMTGFRVGYLAGSPEIVKAAARIHSHVTGNVCAFVQRGALAALDDGTFTNRQCIVMQKRRDLAFRETTKLFDCLKPRGGFFLFPDVRRHLGRGCPDSAALAERLLKEARVAVLPGSACGKEGHIRVSFSTSEADIAEGIRRIREALG